jgi:predicted metal-dependent phosphoesterase TrpH
MFRTKQSYKINALEQMTGVTPGTAMLEKCSKMTEKQAITIGKTGKADLHMHTIYSDGCATIEELLEYVQNHTDLDVIAVTDHDQIEGALRARDLQTRGSYHFEVIVGEEITTKEGHLLGLFIEKRIQPGQSMERSIDLIHEQGGLAVIAHPLHRFFRHSCQKEVMDRIHASNEVSFDGIETWNASFCGIYANAIAMSANRSLYGLAELGNSDAHTLSAVGSGITWFEGKSTQDVRSSIENSLTAPGGKHWDLQVYYHWGRYLMNAEQRAYRRSANMAPVNLTPMELVQ